MEKSDFSHQTTVATFFLDEALDLLHDRLKDTYVILRQPYYMPDDLYKNIKNKCVRTRYFDDLLVNMLNYVGIPYTVSHLKIVENVEDNTAGSFHSTNWSSNEITLNYHSYYDMTTIVSILAHEISHLYLDINNIRFEDTYRNEILTDICAIYLGFQRYMFLGYERKTIRDSFRKKESKVGYLEQSDIEYVSRKIYLLKEKTQLNKEIKEEIKLENSILQLYHENMKKIHKLTSILSRTLINDEHKLSIKSMFEENELHTRYNLLKSNTLNYDKLVELYEEMKKWKNILNCYIFNF